MTYPYLHYHKHRGSYYSVLLSLQPRLPGLLMLHQGPLHALINDPKLATCQSIKRHRAMVLVCPILQTIDLTTSAFSIHAYSYTRTIPEAPKFYFFNSFRTGQSRLSLVHLRPVWPGITSMSLAISMTLYNFFRYPWNNWNSFDEQQNVYHFLMKIIHLMLEGVHVLRT